MGPKGPSSIAAASVWVLGHLEQPVNFQRAEPAPEIRFLGQRLKTQRCKLAINLLCESIKLLGAPAGAARPPGTCTEFLCN